MTADVSSYFDGPAVIDAVPEFVDEPPPLQLPPVELGEDIHDKVPMRVYLSDPCPEPALSRGCAKELVYGSPAIARDEHARLGSRTEVNKKVFDHGKTMHALLMDQEGVIVELPFDNYQTKAAQQAKRAVYAAGKTVFPTGVGMNRSSAGASIAGAGVPHGRGDEPRSPRRFSFCRSCSPRAWG